ncbi:MAG: Gfo/Idh/MocA family oxidoreductase [Candidatus Dormibacteria bacterium]
MERFRPARTVDLGSPDVGPAPTSRRRRRDDLAPLRLALVGAGSMGENHARVIAGSPHATLGVVVDPDGQRAERIAGRYGATAVLDLEGVRSCDAVVVAAPTARHVEIGQWVLGEGLPLLIEKPMATSSTDVQALCALATARNLPLMCGFVERFNAVIGTVAEGLEGQLLHLLALRHSPSSPSAGSSVVWDLLIHDIDLALRLSGESEPVDVTAQSMIPEGSSVSELADCTLRFRSGLIATLSASRVGQRKLRTMVLTTTEAVYEVDLLRQDVTAYRHIHAENQMDVIPRFRSETVIDIPFVRHAGEPLALQLQHFIDVIEGRADLAAELASILPAHRIAERVAATSDPARAAIAP